MAISICNAIKAGKVNPEMLNTVDEDLLLWKDPGYNNKTILQHIARGGKEKELLGKFIHLETTAMNQFLAFSLRTPMTIHVFMTRHAATTKLFWRPFYRKGMTG